MLTFDPLGPGVPASPCEPCHEQENIKGDVLRDITKKRKIATSSLQFISIQLYRAEFNAAEMHISQRTHRRPLPLFPRESDTASFTIINSF